MSREFRYLSNRECVDLRGGTTIVIDVLRAFTTAAWAFHLGASRILLSDDVEEALAIKARIPGALALKDAQPHAGFELMNSPVEIQAHDLKGRAIVQRTTAGTVGAVAARHADQLYCASFVCAAATAYQVRNSETDLIAFVVTGEEGAGEEDRACAEYIAALIEDPTAAPESYVQRAASSAAARLLAQRVAAGTPGVHTDDVQTCLEANRFDFVMRACDEDGLLVLRAYNRNHG